MTAHRVISEALRKHGEPAKNGVLPLRARIRIRRALWAAAFLSVTTWLSATEPPVIKSATWEPPYIDLHLPLKVSSTLRLDLSRKARIRFCVVGPDGRRVKTLISDAVWEKGSHTVAWDGSDDAGRKVPTEAYTISLQEYGNGNWTPAFEPNSDNHGTKISITPVKWDVASGKLLLSVAKPARIRVWIMHGDDGEILACLKDMEPVGAGLLALPWLGLDDRSGLDVRRWGTTGFHFTGYELAQASLLISNGEPLEYARQRSRYPLDPLAVPKAYPDSSALYRREYGDQKELRFGASMAESTLTVSPDALCLPSFLRYSPCARVFFSNGKWTQVDLSPSSHGGMQFQAELPADAPRSPGPVVVVVSTNKDQWGHWILGPEVTKQASVMNGGTGNKK